MRPSRVVGCCRYDISLQRKFPGGVYFCRHVLDEQDVPKEGELREIKIDNVRCKVWITKIWPHCVDIVGDIFQTVDATFVPETE